MPRHLNKIYLSVKLYIGLPVFCLPDVLLFSLCACLAAYYLLLLYCLLLPYYLLLHFPSIVHY